MTDVKTLMSDCTLCPRNCHVDRRAGQKGFCGCSDQIRGARAALHYWEEPCICGKEGSGAVFFSGCSLGCVYCQNYSIARGKVGKEISTERLAEIFLELQEQKARNINLVTATHFVPQVVNALERAKKNGLQIPVVYNTGGYEKTETLRMLEGLVDIYLPDFKYLDPELAERYSSAPDYPAVAGKALEEMVRQTGEPVFRDTDEEEMVRGVIVRHLVLPGQTEASKKVIQYLHEIYGNRIYISILNQFTPVADLEAYPELDRKLTPEEYDDVVDDAIAVGVENGFIQEGDTASESFIPEFDITGI